MRVVVDTNVFVSAVLKDKSFPALALRMVAQRGTLLKSTATERQLFEVLARPQLAALVDPVAVDWMRELMARAEAVSITERIAACRDATDDTFLELSVNGKADVIVSGDADLLVLNPFRGIPIVPPATFARGPLAPN
ncbi:MAG TPA: putative toxin-antitoxin system toxin component, PIN family, partial [Acetobacteraceae bacterium]|nr:putative toxin-antitoxin system toxin component, PIN family [Acetobacteraceae bacterium]